MDWPKIESIVAPQLTGSPIGFDKTCLMLLPERPSFTSQSPTGWEKTSPTAYCSSSYYMPSFTVALTYGEDNCEGILNSRTCPHTSYVVIAIARSVIIIASIIDFANVKFEPSIPNHQQKQPELREPKLGCIPGAIARRCELKATQGWSSKALCVSKLIGYFSRPPGHNLFPRGTGVAS